MFSMNVIIFLIIAAVFLVFSVIKILPEWERGVVLPFWTLYWHPWAGTYLFNSGSGENY